MNGKNEITGEELDSRLNSEAQLRVRATIQALPAESPSMLWRSALNQRVLAVAGKKKAKRRLFWIVSPSLGFLAAGALAVVMFVKPHSPTDSPAPTSTAMAQVSLEDSLFAAHADNSTADDVAGSGLSAREVQGDGDPQVANQDSESQL